MRPSLRIVHPADAPTVLLDSWALTMHAQSLSERTITERRRVITQMARTTGTDPADLTPETLTAWLATLPSAVTRDAYYSITRAWCQWLVRAGHRDDDPTIRVPRPRVPPSSPRPLTRPQVDAVLALPLRVHTRTKVILAAWAGMRIHEIARIRGEDLDVAGETIRITGKGGRTDVVPAHPIILERAAEAGYPARGYWFPSPTTTGRPVAARTVGTVIARALRRAGVHGTAHQLRHFFATELLEAGADSRIVQTLMRHASLATTGRYMGVSAAQQRHALQSLNGPTTTILDTAPHPRP